MGQMYMFTTIVYQLMAKSHLRDRTEPAVFVPEVAMKHDVSSLRYAGVTILGVLMTACAVSWFDNNNQKLFECFKEDLPKTALTNAATPLLQHRSMWPVALLMENVKSLQQMMQTRTRVDNCLHVLPGYKIRKKMLTAWRILWWSR